MKAEIILYMPFGHTERITCNGNEMEIYSSAISWQKQEIAEFIKINNISTPEEKSLVESIITHEIIWIKETDVGYIVLDEACDTNFATIFRSRADAEEFIFTIAEDWAYECLMIGDPEDAIGENEWNYKRDWKFLMNDCANSFKIVEAPLFD